MLQALLKPIIPILPYICMAIIALAYPIWCIIDFKSIKPKHVSIEQQRQLAVQEKQKEAKQKQTDIIEPYYTKQFLQQPQNFDIAGFWNSFKQQHHE